MEQIFNITMHVPLGHRDGILAFETSSEQDIYGTLTLFQSKTPFTGRLMPGGEITFSGQIITLTRAFAYQAHGSLNGTKIKLEITGGGSHFIISGEEAKP